MSKIRYVFILLLTTLMQSGATQSAAQTVAIKSINDAKALIDAHEYEVAVASLKEVMKKPAYAKHADYNKLYGQALVLTGNYDACVEPLEYAMKHGKSGAMYWLAIARQHQYEFDEAIDLLERYKKGHLKQGSLWFVRCDSIIAECEIGQKAVKHVQDIVVIDSMLVPQAHFLEYYHLGSESGMYVKAEDGEVSFRSAADDYRLSAKGDSIWEIHQVGADTWDEASPITSLPAGNKAYPFMRSDGITLYFASNVTPGMGGDDIYVTQYNREEEAFYTPQRLPMPFNSPYNDYAFAIDETHQVGWWATDRHAPKGHIVIYLFMLQDEPEYLEGIQAGRAKIERIADTWKVPSGYADLVKECLTAHATTAPQPITTIFIDDTRTYHSDSEFRSAKAREAYQLTLHMEADLINAQAHLDEQRSIYHNAADNDRRQLKTQILLQEKHVEALMEQIASLQKEYRNQEIRSLSE